MNLTTIGRIVFGLPFAIFGIFHFMMADQMAGMVPSFVPGGVLWVYVIGLALVAAGVAIVLQKMTRMACFGLAALMAIFILTVHIPSMGKDNYAMVNLLKDLAFLGAALYMAGHHEK